jgi:large subunit ribosomal protein L6
MPEFEVPIIEGVDVSAEGGILRVSGPKGELKREFGVSRVKMSKKDGKLVLSVDSERRKDQALLGTWRSHFRNMMTGVTKGYACNLKLIYAHFPIKLEVQGGRLLIKNFLGERSSREADILKGVEVKVEGDIVRLSGIDKEKVGQTAANIESATKVKGFDRRVFQDGLYVMEKTAPPEVS